MIDKLAGLPTQIRQLEKRLKEMDGSKVKPALIKEITDTIQNLKTLLKEKMDKKEQRKKDKAAPQEVEKEAINVPNAATMGATTTTTTTPAPGAATAPTTPQSDDAPSNAPDDASPNCQLCGGITFADYAGYQNHMEFTHASDVMPTTPGQKEDKLVASVDPVVNKVETDPKLAPGVIVPDSVKNHNDIVDRVEKDPKVAPHIISEQEPQFKLDDVVKPVRGSESTGKVMRWDGKPSDLVYVAWDSGPLADRDTFGGYYPHDLELFQEEPVEAAMPEEKPVCNDCVGNKEKQGDLKGNYEALLKDLKEERDAHYAQGNHSWTARLDQKILDLQKAISEKFGNTEKTAEFCEHCMENPCNCSIGPKGAPEKTAAGGPELIRQINKATSGHGYDSTVYSLTNGRFQQNVPLKITDTNVRMRQPENGTFEVKYPGMEWRPVLQPEFDQWLADWKAINQKNNQVEGGAQNAKELTILDHLPPRANKTKDEGGTDGFDEFQDEWAEPVR